MTEIPKSYEAREVEAKWYAAWQEAGCFRGQAEEGQETYSIVIPPPNVTGILHMGHVLNNTLQDVLIRRARLEGKAALWVPGTDHAGIATQTVVERHLRKTEGQSRHDLGREAFLARVWDWRHEKGDKILQQLRELGCSCDWDRTHFTMDEGYSRAVREAFVRLFAQGHIYRGKRMVNWCPVSHTALSDEEVEMRATKGHIWRLRYELVEPVDDHRYIMLETTRPETIAADVAVAVHPRDERFRKLVGRHVWRPLGERVPIPIITDEAVEMEFGGGALKVTPAHDKVDFEIGQRHGLDVIECLDADGTLNALAGPEIAGMERFAGRRKAVEVLDERGALVEAKPYENNVGHSQRAGVPIEPRLMQQWWLRYPRVEEAKQVVRDGLVQFHPARWSKVYLNWLEHIEDWCISRQLWWGHRIPVWYRRGVDRENLTEADLQDPAKIHVSLEGPPDPENWEQEEDVLDTWASSWLWPMGILGWPDHAEQTKADFEAFYPTTTLATGADIIFFWVARMIMAGLEFARPGDPVERRIPFKHVYFNGIVRDRQGRKMSKTLGNSPDPLDLIKRFGADGTRFGLLQMAPLGQDVKFDESRIEGGKNFCNKLWNACRFRMMSGETGDNSSLAAILARLDPDRFDEDDHAILAALLDTMRTLETSFAEFEFAKATQKLYAFFWHDFCDWYVEVAKTRVQDSAAKDHVLAVQDLVIREFLLLFEPFAPFIAEELWHRLGYGEPGSFVQDQRLETAESLAVAIAAHARAVDAAASARVEQLKHFVSQARQLKAEQSVAQKRDAEFHLQADDAGWSAIASHRPKLVGLIGAGIIHRASEEPALPAIISPFGTLFLDTGIAVDPAAERTRLVKELSQVEKHLQGTRSRLANSAFVAKAPAAVIDGAKQQLAELEIKADEIQKLLKSL